MFAFIGKMFTILAPVWYGAAFAFLLSPVYNRLRKHMHKAIASVICLLLALVVVGLVALLIAPALIDSFRQLISNIPSYIDAVDAFMENFMEKNPLVAGSVAAYYSDTKTSITNWIMNRMIPNMSQYVTMISSGVVNVLNFLKNFIIGLIVMVYLLNIKDKLSAQFKKICFSLFRIERANLIIADCRFIHDVFLNFIVGKIIDSLIIAILTFIVLTIFRMPYSIIISVFVGVTNVIPFFGPFIGAIPSAFLLLITSPIQCLEFIIIIIIIQQLDGNLIGPKILGDKTGVSSFWVLFSILLMGGLFGIVGMLIAVPTCAVVQRWIKRGAEARLAKKQLSIDTKDYLDLESIDIETKEYKKNHDIT